MTGTSRRLVAVLAAVLAAEAATGPGTERADAYAWGTLGACAGAGYHHGSSGPCVEVIQRYVNRVRSVRVLFGEYVPSQWPVLRIDGDYGSLTSNAVSRYHRYYDGPASSVMTPSDMSQAQRMCDGFEGLLRQDWESC